ncbi:hypothetical protein [Aliivibrio sifiae]|uniref:Uncharacterized protein n=1 Tax=Aliivibrio sifiae TaxID=566293 RepID=A0A2S7X7U2_9GAMM|nr:hypothetical protein [Aliivibrio sifiae]PQJ87409.1 hypothetical protein BTO23_14930 [Aliivibrio sifiae]GLR77269.1 hypothetical protein GCM10007855_41440 [Aliivibrio sifiae]
MNWDKKLAPKWKQIKGIKLIDGSISEFEVSTQGGVTMYTLPEGNTSKLLKSGDDLILIDIDNFEWLSSDVEFSNY